MCLWKVKCAREKIIFLAQTTRANQRYYSHRYISRSTEYRQTSARQKAIQPVEFIFFPRETIFLTQVKKLVKVGVKRKVALKTQKRGHERIFFPVSEKRRELQNKPTRQLLGFMPKQKTFPVTLSRVSSLLPTFFTF